MKTCLDYRKFLIKNNDPTIFISSQLLIDNSDIGNTIYKIIEKNDKETIYEKDCPKIVNVLQGGGSTLLQNLNYIFVKYNFLYRGY